jgi:hypothetical protein
MLSFLPNNIVAVQRFTKSITSAFGPSGNYANTLTNIACVFEETNGKETTLYAGDRNTYQAVAWFQGHLDIRETDRIVLKNNKTYEIIRLSKQQMTFGIASVLQCGLNEIQV